MKKPDKISLANLPTPIFSFDKINPNKDFTTLYIKRDDFTGMEMSGNKVRKLEYSLKEALDLNAEVFITCGGAQSNHCRATAAAAATLSKKCHLVLRTAPEGIPEGNLFLDNMLNAKITFITPEEYKDNRMDIMKGVQKDYADKGIVAYILPEGASNGIGLFGYYSAYEEILLQEMQLGVTFDTICIADGSGGTYAGLYAANEVYGKNKKIVGVNIYNAEDDGRVKVSKIIDEAVEISGYNEPINRDNMHVLIDYVGEGYSIASDEVRAFIRDTARNTGVVFDPVYTGKSFCGLIEEIKKENPLLKGNVLYIHTGGLFGVFPQKELFF